MMFEMEIIYSCIIDCCGAKKAGMIIAYTQNSSLTIENQS